MKRAERGECFAAGFAVPRTGAEGLREGSLCPQSESIERLPTRFYRLDYKRLMDVFVPVPSENDVSICFHFCFEVAPLLPTHQQRCEPFQDLERED